MGGLEPSQANKSDASDFRGKPSIGIWKKVTTKRFES